MSFISVILDTITCIIGGSLFVIMSLSAIFCSLQALLSISNENRIFFRRTIRSVGVGIAIFGLLLPFRKFSILPTLICIGWTLIFFETIPMFQFYQALAAVILTLVFWIPHLWNSKPFFLATCGDLMVFVIIPIVFATVQFSRGSEQLIGREASKAGPKIPTQSLLSKLASLARTIIPPSSP